MAEQISDRTDEQNTAADENAEIQVNTEKKRGRLFKFWAPKLLTVLVIFILITVIRSQASEIDYLYERISSQRKDLATYERYVDKTTYLSSYVDPAFSLLKSGDRIEAVRTAFKHFPHTTSPHLFYMPQGAYALTEGLHAYTNGTVIMPDRQIKQKKEISHMELSAGGSLLLTWDKDSLAYVRLWRTEDGTCMRKFSQHPTDEKTRYAFLGDTRLFYPTDTGLALYDSETDTELYSIDCGCYQMLVVDEEQGRMLVLESGPNPDDYMVRTDTGEIQYPFTVPDDCKGQVSGAAFCKEDKFALLISNYSGGGTLLVYSTIGGTLLQSYPIYSEGLLSASLYEADGIFYVLQNAYDNLYSEQWNRTLSSQHVSLIHAFDPDQAQPLWTGELPGEYFYRLAVPAREDSEWLVCAGKYKVVILNREDGSCETGYDFDSPIVKIGNYRNIERKNYRFDTDGSIHVFTEDGKWYDFSVSTTIALEREDFVPSTLTDVKQFEAAAGCAAALAASDNKVTFYRNDVGNRLTVFHETEGAGRYDRGIIDSSGQYLAVLGISPTGEGGAYLASYVEMYDTASGSLRWSAYYAADDFSRETGMSFYPERNAFALFTCSTVYLLDQDTGEELDRYVLYDEELELSDYNRFSTDTSGRYAFVESHHEILGFDLKEMRIVYRIPIGRYGYPVIAWAVSSNLDYCALYNKDEKELSVYRLSDWLTEDGTKNDLRSTPEALARLSTDSEESKALKHLFFGECGETLELYVVYNNGETKAYPISPDSAGNTDAAAAPGIKISTWNARTYQDLDDIMTSYIYTDGSDYAVAVGEYYFHTCSNAYLFAYAPDTYPASSSTYSDSMSDTMVSNWRAHGWKNKEIHGQIIGHIQGFLALDGANNLIYMTDGKCIYRAPIYNAAMLSEEAEKLLSSATSH